MQIISRNMLITLKKTWEGIKKIIDVKKTNKTSQLNIGGMIIDNDKQIAIVINFKGFEITNMNYKYMRHGWGVSGKVGGMGGGGSSCYGLI